MYLYLIPSLIGIISASLNAYGGTASFFTLISIGVPLIMGTDIDKAINGYRKGYRPNFNATNRLKQTLFISTILVIVSAIVNTMLFHQTFIFAETLPLLEESLTFYGEFFDSFINKPDVCCSLWIISIFADISSKIVFWVESRFAIKKHSSVFL